MEEYEEIKIFVYNLETHQNFNEEENIIQLLEKANKYIIILNKYISEDVIILKDLYSIYFQELPTIVTNNYEYVKSIKIIEENKQILKEESKTGIKSFLPNNVLMTLAFILTSSNIMKINSEEKSLEIKKEYTKILDLFQKKTTLLNFI